MPTPTATPAPASSTPQTVPRPQGDWRLLLRLFPFARQSQKLLLASTLLLIPLSLAGAVQPIIIGQAISLLRGEPTFAWLKAFSLSQGLNWLAGFLLFTLVIRLGLEGVQGYLVQKMGQQVTAAIRNTLFDHVTSLSARFFDRTPIGKLITRLTSDVEVLGDVFATGTIGIVSDLFMIAVVTVVMFSQQWQLASVLVLLLLPVSGLIIYFQNQYRRAFFRSREELSALNTALQENVVGINVVQLFRRERYNASLFHQTNQRYLKAVDETIFHDSAISATLEWIALMAIATVLCVGSFLVVGETLKLGLLVQFIFFAQKFFDPLRQFAEKFTLLQSGFTAVERICLILDEPIEIQDVDKPLSLAIATHPKQQGEIRFENVWFSYETGKDHSEDSGYVLKNLNFTIRPGEKVALVGPTGAGKSSIIRLLCRLYEPTQGQIYVDGMNIRDLPQTDLRRHLGVILQDGFLFSGDVKSNIALGETYSLAAIQSAANQTNVGPFIEQLPQGYNTVLRERGTNLSGGQKQLLAFARVAIREPKILILDEATASLDVGTEALIQKALEQLLVNRTAIIIAHRLSTIRTVDRILVLKRGELVESGTHDALLAANGLYSSLYRLQLLTDSTSGMGTLN